MKRFVLGLLLLAASCKRETPAGNTGSDAAVALAPAGSAMADAAVVRAPVESATAVASASATASASGTKPRTKPGECIVVDTRDLSGERVTLTGTVFSGKHSHPNGSTFEFLGLRLDKPKCVEGFEETKQVSEVQLAPGDDGGKALGRLEHKKAQIVGSAFPEHTAWHVRPILISVEKVEPL